MDSIFSIFCNVLCEEAAACSILLTKVFIKFHRIKRKTPVLESIIFSKATDLKSTTLLKKILQHRYFSVNSAKF